MITNKKERLTCQKKIILDYLKRTSTHPTADVIYSAVKRKLPQISLGTIYRNLKIMREKGEVLEIPGEISRWDGELSPHSHFICRKCKRIYDVFKGSQLLRLRRNLKIGKVTNYQVYFYGICKNCEKR